MKSLDAFIEAINEHPKIKRFKELESTLKNDSNLEQLIQDMKDIQKEYVHAKTFQQKDNEKFLLDKLTVIQQDIDTYPLFYEYLELQDEINEMLQRFTNIFEDELDKKLENIKNI